MCILQTLGKHGHRFEHRLANISSPCDVASAKP